MIEINERIGDLKGNLFLLETLKDVNWAIKLLANKWILK